MTRPARAAATYHSFVVLCWCCLRVGGAPPAADHKDELIQSAIEELDTSIRLLRGTTAEVLG